MDLLELSSAGAPREFPVPSSPLESSRSSNGGVMSCRVCLQLRSNFFCDECVRNGNFTHSHVLCPERFAEKKLRLMRLQRQKASLESSILQLSAPVLKKEALREAIQRTRDQVAYLRIVLEDLKSEAQEWQRQLRQKRAECEAAERDAVRVRERLSVRSQQLGALQESLEGKRQQQAECHRRRQALVRAYVGDLARDIFPIKEHPWPHSGSGGGGGEGTSSGGGRELRELEEAQQTVYVRGRWVHLAPTEGCYTLVGVRLPTSGDYSQYCHWLAEQQERAWPAPEEPCNVGYTLAAGLMYAAQMVAVLAYYLDVPLPHSLCYSQFGARDESEEDFRNWVARLNSNVLHLCASQGLEPPLLRPRTTLRNLSLLVQHQGNIRLGPFEMSSDLWASLEESLGPELQPSDPDSDDNDDWEDVTEDSSPRAELQWRPSSPQPSSSLLSSAAALVTNFWRPK
uniref:Putative beclin 1-associated autophagy-related key regulator-like protein n=1 Tax=Amblyomma triste TaxID=251400 RepID=A0A023GFW1_AMBTT